MGPRESRGEGAEAREPHTAGEGGSGPDPRGSPSFHSFGLRAAAALGPRHSLTCPRTRPRGARGRRDRRQEPGGRGPGDDGGRGRVAAQPGRGRAAQAGGVPLQQGGAEPPRALKHAGRHRTTAAAAPRARGPTWNEGRGRGVAQAPGRCGRMSRAASHFPGPGKSRAAEAEGREDATAAAAAAPSGAGWRGLERHRRAPRADKAGATTREPEGGLGPSAARPGLQPPGPGQSCLQRKGDFSSDAGRRLQEGQSDEPPLQRF
ncbi:uncharacterized protein LOC144366479 [Ictidomys tridecemlineatus]